MGYKATFPVDPPSFSIPLYVENIFIGANRPRKCRPPLAALLPSALPPDFLNIMKIQGLNPLFPFVSQEVFAFPQQIIPPLDSFVHAVV